jgi:hypothetical protein
MNDQEREMNLLCEISAMQYELACEISESLYLASRTDPTCLPSLRIALKDQELAREIDQRNNRALNELILKNERS